MQTELLQERMGSLSLNVRMSEKELTIHRFRSEVVMPGKFRSELQVRLFLLLFIYERKFELGEGGSGGCDILVGVALHTREIVQSICSPIICNFLNII